MIKKILILTIWGFLITISSAGQCAERDQLWKRLVFLRDSPGISREEQLQLILAEETIQQKCPIRNDSVYAFLLRRIGVAYYGMSDYLNAIKYYRRSIDVISTNAGSHAINPKHLIPCYYGLSLQYDSLNRVTEKMTALDSCFTIAIRFQSVDIFCLSALYKRVEYYYDIGDYHHCIDYATICETLAKKYAARGNLEFNDGFEYASSSMVWRVNALIMLKKYPEVEILLNQKIRESKNTVFRFNQGSMYAQLAQLEGYKGNYDKSLYYLKQALFYERRMGNDVNCKTILNLIGYDIYFKHYHNLDSALFYYRKALFFGNSRAVRERLDSIESLNVLSSIASLYNRKNMFDSACRYFQLAFDQVGPGASELSILNSSLDEFARQKKIGYLTELFIDKGNAFFHQYKRTNQRRFADEAVRIYKMTDKLLDKIKNEQVDLESKLFWRADSRRLYELAIQACKSIGNMSDAFYFFEKSRAVLLNDQLNEQRWLGEGEIEKQTQVKKKILQIERDLSVAGKSKEAIEDLRNKLFNEMQIQDNLVQSIKSKNPLYYQSFLDTGVLTILDVQHKILSGHKALVEIFEGDSAVYSFIITPERSFLSEIDKSLFDSLSRSYLAFISNPVLINKEFGSFLKVSRKLYQLIFEKVSLQDGRIIVSPDGQYFPFESLVTSDEASPVNYLLNNFSVSYTYSARYLMNGFATNLSGPSFMGMAPVQYPAGMQLASLIGSDLSLVKLKSYFRDGNGLFNEEASRANFLNQFYKYKVIQLYTHASGSGENDEPVIYFADSAMFLSDLFCEKKPATQLIVLAACETGNGREYKGEGVFSFNRAFAAIGIPSSISNLWAVENESMYRLTELFYEQLANGKQADIAMQQAKIEFIKTSTKEKQLPYFWAAPILIGSNHAIEITPRINWKKIAIIISALLIAGGLGYRKFYAGRKQFRSRTIKS